MTVCGVAHEDDGAAVGGHVGPAGTFRVRQAADLAGARCKFIQFEGATIEIGRCDDGLPVRAPRGGDQSGTGIGEHRVGRGGTHVEDDDLREIPRTPALDHDARAVRRPARGGILSVVSRGEHLDVRFGEAFSIGVSRQHQISSPQRLTHRNNATVGPDVRVEQAQFAAQGSATPRRPVEPP